MDYLPYTSLEDEIEIKCLEIQGRIPPWLSGIFLRNGPSKFEVGDQRLHWLDGLAMLHAFTFHNGTLSYRNKFLRTDYYKSVYEKRKLPYKTFASDPCKTLFNALFSYFYPFRALSLHAQNTNVNITKIAQHFVALTEVPLSVEFDPETLETLGVFKFEDQLEQHLRFETAHPHYDPIRKEAVNYYIKYGIHNSYHLFRVPDGVTERKQIASIPVQEPAYMHSFAITPHYVVLAEFPFVVNPLQLLLKGKPFIHNFRWEPERGTRFQVVERTTGHHVGTYLAKPYFAFHHINAFENAKGLIIDIVTYPTPSIIQDTHTDMLLNAQKELRRFEIHFDHPTVSSTLLSSYSLEMPRINYEAHNGSFYHYVYGLGPQCQLAKVNVEEGTFQEWSQEHCFAGEPVFIPSPGAKKEDEGILLSIVLDCKKKVSFLLILNAVDFSEICQAEVPHAIPFGLHGQYFPRW